MKTTIQIDEKPLTVSLSEDAVQALRLRSTPLLAEMELYFSCLIRLKVRFYENNAQADATAVNELLRVRFRPVMTQKCGHDYEGEEPPLTDFPISNRRPFIPRWLKLDYKNHQWQGEFGFAS